MNNVLDNCLYMIEKWQEIKNAIKSKKLNSEFHMDDLMLIGYGSNSSYNTYGRLVNMGVILSSKLGSSKGRLCDKSYIINALKSNSDTCIKKSEELILKSNTYLGLIQNLGDM